MNRCDEAIVGIGLLQALFGFALGVLFMVLRNRRMFRELREAGKRNLPYYDFANTGRTRTDRPNVSNKELH